MTTATMHSTAASAASQCDVVQLDAPPRVQDRGGAGGVALTVLPMLGSLGSVALFAGVGGQSPMRYAAAGLLLLTTAAAVVVQLDRQRTNRARRTRAARADYLRHLDSVRRRARDAADVQREALGRLHPPPHALPAATLGQPEKRWRDPDHPAFLQIRWATGDRPAALGLLAPEDQPDVDHACLARARGLVEVHRTQPALPLTIDLRAHRRVCVTTDAAARARALICSAVAAHRPEQLLVAVLADRSSLGEWDWTKWLPHAGSPVRRDAVGPVRLTRCSWPELAQLLPPSGCPAPHVLLVVATHQAVLPEPSDGRTVLVLGSTDGPDRHDEESMWAQGAKPDRCDLVTAEALARRLAATATSTGRSASGAADLTELLSVRSTDDRLSVPIGTGDGEVIRLDLEEAARGGMGPHGLVIGATGSGKSELLRTLVLGLSLTHPPDRVNLVLIDFKGGATFAGLADLPHVSAVITNLDDDRAMVDRMQDALSGELVRRQQLLRDSDFGSRHDHEQARRTGLPLPAVPSLVVVVDEFSELLAAEPGLIDLFVSIGRLGRSLGIHLVLASQRLEEGRLRGLDSHLSYRIALRTFSAQESRTVIGVPDAYELPATPGVGYLRTDPATLRRFTTAYVSGPVTGPPLAPVASEILPFTVLDVAAPRLRAAPPSAPAGSFFDLAVRRLASSSVRAHQIWLPPLAAPPSLAGPGGLIDDLRREPRLGLFSPRWRSAGPCVVPAGTIDRPRDQRRDVLHVDLSGAAGHVAVVGAPRSGKTTLVQTLLLGLALTTTPQETQLYLLDLGGALAPLAGLPHHAGSAGRSEPQAVRRVVAEVSRLLARREEFFRTKRIGSIETYRKLRAAGEPGDGYGEVFLVVDGWGTLRAEYDDLEPQIAQLQARGLGFGIHLVASALRWSEFRASVRDLFGTRLELRLGDPMDSELGRAAAARVPSSPGRGLTSDGLHFLSALPCLQQRTTGVGTIADLVTAISDAWSGPPAPPLRVLPARIGLEALAEAGGATGAARQIVLGVDEDLDPVRVDIDAQPHLLVLGGPGSGRTSLLRALCRQLAAGRSPHEARLLVIDPRRTLLGEVSPAHILGHVSAAPEAEQAVAELASYLTARLPGPGVTADQLRRRSWWSGAEVFVLVDDYDLLTGTTSPLAPLQPLLARASDVGLHLAVTRRTGGAVRALHDPVVQALRDLGQPGLLLSGDPEEGPLIGGLRPVPAPPGRARLVTRDRPAREIQLMWTDPSP